jgi:hypothetical protein
MSDHELEQFFGVDQSTVWRLKHGKTQKIQRYIAALERRLGAPDPTSDQEILSDLEALSRHSPEVRRILRSLHSLMRESA